MRTCRGGEPGTGRPDQRIPADQLLQLDRRRAVATVNPAGENSYSKPEAHSGLSHRSEAALRRPKLLRSRSWFVDDCMVSEREDLFTHYAGHDEGQRLFRFRHNRLELLRTRELLQRQLPSPPAVVLDVGGGTGGHAAWLAGRVYRVHLVDLVPEHVRAAAEYGLVTAEVGDARRLTQTDASVDAVLLLGPLYHLVGRAERIVALAEARRVLRSGGVLLAAAIGRFMAVLDWAQSGGLTADVAAKLAPVLSTGLHDPALGFTQRLLPYRRSAAAGGGGGRVRRRTRDGHRGAGVDHRRRAR